MIGHDGRCEAPWNDGVCACADRAENATYPWRIERTPSRLSRILERIVR